MLQLPAAFTHRMQTRLGAAENAAFEAALQAEVPVSVQLNPFKNNAYYSAEHRVPWHPKGHYLTSRPVFTLDPNFQAGSYYVQEASSMFIGWLAQQLPNDKPWKVLDLCAAPGGKSCLLAAIMPKGSLLVSNEVIKSRYGILKYNLAKWGIDNCWTTNLDPERFSSLKGYFDLVVVDAPCSGEGMFRKDPNAINEWSPEHVELCGLRQERILNAAAPLVKQDGLLLYSSCTYNQRENEAQATWLTKNFNFELLHPSPPSEWNIAQEGVGYRFYPHRTKGEGFFAFAAKQLNDYSSKYKKKRPGHWTPLKEKETELSATLLENPANYRFYSDKHGNIHALNKNWQSAAEEMVAAVGRIDLGFPVGQIKGKQIVPAAELALHLERKQAIDSYSVDRITALQLLKKETPSLPELQRGWQLITHNNNGLLWVKGLGNRYNNYYPAGWRIRMAVQ